MFQITRNLATTVSVLFFLVPFVAPPAHAQNGAAVSENVSNADLARQVTELRSLVLQLQAQVRELQHQPVVVQTAAYSPDIHTAPVLTASAAEPVPPIATNVTPQP